MSRRKLLMTDDDHSKMLSVVGLMPKMIEWIEDVMEANPKIFWGEVKRDSKKYISSLEKCMGDLYSISLEEYIALFAHRWTKKRSAEEIEEILNRPRVRDYIDLKFRQYQYNLAQQNLDISNKFEKFRRENII